uniref:Collagen type XXVI alpha 1 chain n=1 Tax=Athene cunicularia TaxID=194338 RepID=A0A663MN55_ATHCN
AIGRRGLIYVGSACCLTGANSVLSLCRHWCHYTVTRTVSCQVQNGSETVIQRVYQSCRWPGPCANLVSYRTLIRPTYKMSYRTVTTLEWRCCPGFTGSNCEEGKHRALPRAGRMERFFLSHNSGQKGHVFLFNCCFLVLLLHRVSGLDARASAESGISVHGCESERN